MLSTMLQAKLHQARVTDVELEYEGSCAIDGHLLNTAGIREYQQIHIYNMNNGERFITYAIRAEDNSGIISINGAAAHKASRGDRIIICCYAELNSAELLNFKPTLVYLDERNRITRTSDNIPVQVA